MSEILSGERISESKSVATDRLRREGRWNEASQFKDQTIARLRAEGRTKGEANEIAWTETIAAFPPLPAATKSKVPDPLDITSADAELIDRLAAIPVDWDRDVLWCYRYMPHPQVQLDQAPSLSAWGLLRIAREDPAKFLVQVAASAARTTKGGDDRQSPKVRVTQDPGLADLERMIADLS